jgi:ABC-type uncharacterized transport system ATPase subunit
VQLADRILLFDQGRLLAEGTHDSLSKTHALSSQLLAEIGYTGKESQMKGRGDARAWTTRHS